MNKNELKKKAEDYFKLYPKKGQLYATSDGNFFVDKASALNHSKSAKIECFEFVQGKEDEIKESIGDLSKMLVDTDLETADYTLLKKCLKDIGVKLEKWDKESVKNAFISLKEEMLLKVGSSNSESVVNADGEVEANNSNQ